MASPLAAAVLLHHLHAVLGRSSGSSQVTTNAFQGDRYDDLHNVLPPDQLWDMFNQADTDKDGFVTEAEFDAQIASEMPPPDGENPNGHLSDLPEFQRIDTSGDGLVSYDEFNVHMTAIAKQYAQQSQAQSPSDYGEMYPDDHSGGFYGAEMFDDTPPPWEEMPPNMDRSGKGRKRIPPQDARFQLPTGGEEDFRFAPEDMLPPEGGFFPPEMSDTPTHEEL